MDIVGYKKSNCRSQKNESGSGWSPPVVSFLLTYMYSTILNSLDHSCLYTCTTSQYRCQLVYQGQCTRTLWERYLIQRISKALSSAYSRVTPSSFLHEMVLILAFSYSPASSYCLVLGLAWQIGHPFPLFSSSFLNLWILHSALSVTYLP